MASAPFVKVPGEIPTQAPGTWNQYCKHKLDQLFERYAKRGPKRRLVIATDAIKSLQSQHLSKYFKVVEIERLAPLARADAFWFESRRATKPATGPCSLFFQNSVEDYEQLHLKNELYALATSSNHTSYFPVSYNLDNPADCAKFFSSLDATSNSQSSGAVNYLLKAEGQDVMLLGGDRLEELKRAKQSGEICGKKPALLQVQKIVRDTVP